jgi:hypothetical protein
MTSNLCVELWESNEVGHKHLGGHCTHWTNSFKLLKTFEQPHNIQKMGPMSSELIRKMLLKLEFFFDLMLDHQVGWAVPAYTLDSFVQCHIRQAWCIMVYVFS